MIEISLFQLSCIKDKNPENPIYKLVSNELEDIISSQDEIKIICKKESENQYKCTLNHTKMISISFYACEPNESYEEITVNKKELEEFFGSETVKMREIIDNKVKKDFKLNGIIQWRNNI